MSKELRKALEEADRPILVDWYGDGLGYSADGGKTWTALASQSPPPTDDVRARELIHESLFHLRCDERAKQYHDKAEAFLSAQLPPPIRGVRLREAVEALFAGGFVEVGLRGEPDQWKQEFERRTDAIRKALATPSSPKGWVLPDVSPDAVARALRLAVELVGKEADQAMHVRKATRDVVESIEESERILQAMLAASPSSTEPTP